MRTIKEKIERDTARIKSLKLRVMCIHIPEKEYVAFKVKLARDGITVMAFILAAIELYLEGGFEIDKESEIKG